MTLTFPAIDTPGRAPRETLTLRAFSGGGELLFNNREDEVVELLPREMRDLGLVLMRPVPELPNGRRNPELIFNLKRRLSVQQNGRSEMPHSHIFFSNQRGFSSFWLAREHVVKLAVALMNAGVERET